MDTMAAMDVEGTGQRRLCEACRGDAGAGEFIRSVRAMPGTSPEAGDRGFSGARPGSKTRIKYRQIAFTSRGASVCRWRGRTIREKIIGRSAPIFRERFSSESVFLHLLRALPLFHQPARQHGGGIFLHPQVEKSADLLAKIGGMAETREFVALQRVARSGEQELPRRLGLVVVHEGLLGSNRRTLTLN
jgi:hypothetical protein